MPGATYRVLRGGDGKLGMYHVLLAGGRLDSEMFPESMAIRSFATPSAYARSCATVTSTGSSTTTATTPSRHTNEAA